MAQSGETYALGGAADAANGLDDGGLVVLSTLPAEPVVLHGFDLSDPASGGDTLMLGDLLTGFGGSVNDAFGLGYLSVSLEDRTGDGIDDAILSIDADAGGVLPTYEVVIFDGASSLPNLGSFGDAADVQAALADNISLTV
jgi:hypothetical protein